MITCRLCHKEFKYYHKKGRARCGSCNTKIRRYRAKAAAIKFLGGKCQHCNWKGDQSAFQFHHLKPEEKDFIIGNVANKKWDFIKIELKKCILLCSNCHSIVHSTKIGKNFIKEAEAYKGRNLEF
ncbi:MAG: hypothetical protein COX02_02110 [Candidatus Vogelbacteria bacterium CG22_combo_CG10-13_8_21_14_all_37_9]|uniref:HNH domain-containing protein n=1 Tax=Candidatus Vogelbacteria bacterium CG22_combo_CG10-13_8_21_14_all_37_9 TaxID=1975046 RepID=A0A2H0BKH1_9BACT|nr:MAG: hypothetical protein COX02_02110 [Candidatus Vogelbacteria bacterium CG22_combo_CG10-13_8_21_14_all_37_9]